MATTQQIVGILKKAGLKSQKITRGKVRRGYSVSKWNRGLIGVCLGYNDSDSMGRVKGLMEDAGLKYTRRVNMASDGYFVE